MNTRDSIMKGRSRHKGQDNASAKMLYDDIQKIRVDFKKLIAAFKKQTKEQYGIEKTQLDRILKGTCWGQWL